MNDNGLKIVTSFEGCRLTAYQDQKGIWSIGFGCTHHVTPNLVITRDDAVNRLKEDLVEFQTELDRFLGPCKPNINSDQYSALQSLLYNIGSVDFSTSTLLHCVRMRQFDDAAKQFPRWDKCAGVPDKGLLRRRMAEKSLFISDLVAMDNYIADPHSVDTLFGP
jgi:lysozyme